VPGEHKLDLFLLRIGALLDALTRGLPLEILTRGYGMESRNVMVSFQASSSTLGLVLPSNSPGVHTLWLPAIPLQIGLVLKPGSSEPWTPYRMYEAFAAAGVPREAFCLYPGPHEVGNKVLETCNRAMIFGGQATVDKYHGNPRVQAHGPGFSKILLGRASGCHGDERADERRTQLHQLFGDLGFSSYRSNRRRDSEEARPNRSTADH
jgi:hypothetical protein